MEIKPSMSIEDFYLNIHIYAFFFFGFLAIILIINAGSSYRNRTGKIIIGCWDFKYYSKKEKKILSIGVVLLVSSIVGLMLVLDRYGHNVRYIDQYGNVEVKNEKINLFH